MKVLLRLLIVNSIVVLVNVNVNVNVIDEFQ